MCKTWPGGRCSGHTYTAVQNTVKSMRSLELSLKEQLDKAKITQSPEEFEQTKARFQGIQNDWNSRLDKEEHEYYSTKQGVQDLHQYALRNQRSNPEAAAVALRLANEFEDRRRRQNEAYRTGITRHSGAEAWKKTNEYIGTVDTSSPEAQAVLKDLRKELLSEQPGKVTPEHNDDGKGADLSEKAQAQVQVQETIKQQYSEVDASGLSEPVKQRMGMALESTVSDVRRCQMMTKDAAARQRYPGHNQPANGLGDRFDVMADKFQNRLHASRLNARRQETLRKINGLQDIVNKIPSAHGMTDELRQDWNSKLEQLKNDFHESGTVTDKQDMRDTSGPFAEMLDTLRTMQGQMHTSSNSKVAA